jgi:hypothetical protein
MMRRNNFITEPSKKVEVIETADIIICGGGPSGIIAAVASGRNGLKTVLIEKYGFLGGMATAGLVGPMSKFKLNQKWIVGGIPKEFIYTLKDHNGAITNLPSGNVPFDPEVYKSQALRLTIQAGTKLILHSKVVSSIKSNKGAISHIIIETPSGRKAVQGKYFIDCTGCGDLIYQSSLPWKMRSSPNNFQPLSLQFRLGGVDTDSLSVIMSNDNVKYRNTDLRKILTAEQAKGGLSNFGGPWAVWGSTIRKGEVSVNATRFSGNAVNVREITDAEIQMRQDMIKIIQLFQKYASPFKDCYLIDSAVQAGIRETRSIIGEYELTNNDVLRPVNFPDTIAQGGHPVDIHLPAGSGQKVNFLKEAYNIPYRCIVPKGSKNVLVSGGLISAEKEAFATARVQAQCMAVGEAAGTAAALCCLKNISVNELDGKTLRQQLHMNGALVGKDKG